MLQSQGLIHRQLVFTLRRNPFINVIRKKKKLHLIRHQMYQPKLIEAKTSLISFTRDRGQRNSVGQIHWIHITCFKIVLWGVISIIL